MEVNLKKEFVLTINFRQIKERCYIYTKCFGKLNLIVLVKRSKSGEPRFNSGLLKAMKFNGQETSILLVIVLKRLVHS